MKRILLVVNEDSRAGGGVRTEIGDAFRSLGHEVLHVASDGIRDVDAIRSSYEGVVDLVAVGGGDGTLLSAIPAIRALRIALLVIPLGTTNELARTLSIPAGHREACELVDSGGTLAIDLGVVNGTYFLNEASVGLSTHVARAQTELLKRTFGMFATPLAIVRSLRWMRPHTFAVDTDGAKRTFDTVQLTVANSGRFGGVVENPEASLTDGNMNLYSVDVREWRDAIAIVTAIALRRFPKAHCVTTVTGTRFVVRSRNPEAVFADGEPATHTPAEFTIQCGAIDVFVPECIAAASQP